MSRYRYFVIRTIQTVIMLWVAFTAIFLLFRIMPGSFTDILIQAGATPESIQAFEERWGLNDPIYVQYWRYLNNIVELDFGDSIQFSRPVVDYVGIKIVNSVILAAPALTLGYIVGILIGTILAEKRGTWIEKIGVMLPITYSSFPSFYMAILLLIVFASWLGWVPTYGMVESATLDRFQDAPWWRIYFTRDFLFHYSLPFMTIFLRYLYYPLLITRTSVIETKGEPFYLYQRLSGLPYATRLIRTAKHGVLPVITLYPISLSRAIGGLVLVEMVFNWPGVGSTLVTAVFARDFPVVQFIFTLMASFIIIGNFAVDLLYGVIDPRISISDSA